MLSNINRIQGSGIILRDSTRNPPKVRKMLQKIGSEQIQSIQLVRTPLAKSTNILLRIVTLGQLEDKLKDTKIDKLFHLSMFINNKYILEKNEVISLKQGNPVTSNSETLIVPINKYLTISQMLDNTMRYMGDKYGSYNAVDNNCGDFISGILSANGLQTENSKIFCHQKVAELFSKFPSLSQFITNLATDAGAFVDRQVQGEGRKRRL